MLTLGLVEEHSKTKEGLVPGLKVGTSLDYRWRIDGDGWGMQGQNHDKRIGFYSTWGIKPLWFLF